MDYADLLGVRNLEMNCVDLLLPVILSAATCYAAVAKLYCRQYRQLPCSLPAQHLRHPAIVQFWSSKNLKMNFHGYDSESKPFLDGNNHSKRASTTNQKTFNAKIVAPWIIHFLLLMTYTSIYVLFISRNTSFPRTSLYRMIRISLTFFKETSDILNWSYRWSRSRDYSNTIWWLREITMGWTSQSFNRRSVAPSAGGHDY